MAEPGEDWHNLSDAATRRRIQNRIAQRNYRRNMRKRLRELEEELRTRTAAATSPATASAQTTFVPRNASHKRRAEVMPPSTREETATKKQRLSHKTAHVRAFSESISLPPNNDHTKVSQSVSDLGEHPASAFDLSDVVSPSNDFPLYDPTALWTFPTPLPTPTDTFDFQPIAPEIEWSHIHDIDISPTIAVDPQPDPQYSLPDEADTETLCSPALVGTSLSSSSENDSPLHLSTPSQAFTGQSTLHLAAKKGHHSIVALLLSRGSPINDTDNLGQSALHLAASSGHDAIVDLLIKERAFVYLKDLCGRTALHLAAAGGHVGVVRMLLERGEALPGIDAVDSMGRTTLHAAIEGGWEEVVGLLLDCGADSGAKIVSNWVGEGGGPAGEGSEEL